MYDFITIDFETANNNMNSACSVGIVGVKDLAISFSEYYLIKPPTDTFRKENTEIHGLTFEDVKDAEGFPFVWKKIKHYFENEMIIAHNAQFDMSVLKSCLDSYGIPNPDFNYLDSIVISNPICGSSIGTSLDDRATYFSIDMKNHHNALDDAATCANIVICSLKTHELTDITKYLRLHKNIKVHDFQSIKANKTMNGAKRPSYSNIKMSEITAATSEFDKKHPFYKKNIVFTGELLNYDRKEAMQIVADLGGVNKSGVSSITHYLIVGVQDKKLVGEDGLSGKEEKAYDLIKRGFDIKVIHEDEFTKIANKKI